MVIRGRLERSEGVINIVAEHLAAHARARRHRDQPRLPVSNDRVSDRRGAAEQALQTHRGLAPDERQLPGIGARRRHDREHGKLPDREDQHLPVVRTVMGGRRGRRRPSWPTSRFDNAMRRGGHGTEAGRLDSDDSAGTCDARREPVGAAHERADDTGDPFDQMIEHLTHRLRDLGGHEGVIGTCSPSLETILISHTRVDRLGRRATASTRSAASCPSRRGAKRVDVAASDLRRSPTSASRTRARRASDPSRSSARVRTARPDQVDPVALAVVPARHRDEVLPVPDVRTEVEPDEAELLVQLTTEPLLGRVSPSSTPPPGSAHTVNVGNSNRASSTWSSGSSRSARTAWRIRSPTQSPGESRRPSLKILYMSYVSLHAWQTGSCFGSRAGTHT